LFGPDTPSTIAEFRDALRNAPFGEGIGDGRFLAAIRDNLDLPPASVRPTRPDPDLRGDDIAGDLLPFPGPLDSDSGAAQALAPVLAGQPPAAEGADRTDIFDNAPVPPQWANPSAPFVRVDGLYLNFIRDMELGPVPDARFKGLRASGNGEQRGIFEGPGEAPDSGHAALPGPQVADLPGPPDLFF
jgi:hypothetical protein